MATSTVEKTKGQVGSEKQDKVVMGKELEQQTKDEQWGFIRDEVEKMKEARELAQKQQQELQIEQERIREQKAKLEAEEEMKASSTVRKDTEFNTMSQKGT